ncbi:MAG: hypothetical protein WCD76_07925 [Pyrinomonadaceae bacterium]
MKIEGAKLKDLLISEEKAIDEAMHRAMRQALLMHKRAGHPVASWKDGKVVMIPANRIPVEDERVKRNR